MKVFSLILLVSVVDTVLSDRIIGNGKVILGVSDYGNLNVKYEGGGLGLPIDDPLKINNVGIRNGNDPNGDAGRYAGLEYVKSEGWDPEGWGSAEGWGAGVKTFNMFTSSCGTETFWPVAIYSGMELISSSGKMFGSTATSEVTCGIKNMEVLHYFQPSESPDLMYVGVTIRNTGLTDFEEVHYRRVMDWGIYPTPVEEYITHIGVSSTSSLYYSNDNGSCTPRLAYDCDPRTTENVDFTDSGPFDHGSMFQFNFGRLKAGESYSFQIYYGLSLGEDAAMAAVESVGAELVSLAQQPLEGDPYTFIFAVSGVQGLPILSSAPSVSSAPSTSVAPSVSPTVAPLFTWFLVNADKDVDISKLSMNQVLSFSGIGTKLLSTRLETPSNTKRVVFTWREDSGVVKTNTEIFAPFYMNRNNKTDAFTVRYLRSVGTKTVNATMKDSSGIVIGTSTIRFDLIK